MSKSSGFAIGFFSFLTGVAVGMLLAPKSGKELRKDIKDAAARLPQMYDDIKFSTPSQDEIEHELLKR